MKTLTGFSTIMNFERDGIAASTLFKRLAIFFDDIIFNQNLCPIGKGFLFETQSDYLARVVAADVNESQTLVKNKKFSSIFLNCWDFVEDEEAFERGLSNTLSPEIKDKIFSYAYGKEMPEGEFIHTKEFKQLCGDMWHDMQLYAGFRKIEPNVAGNLSSHFGDVFSNMSRSEGYLVNELSNNSSMIPDFGDFTWDQIIELREDKIIKYFREKIESALTDTPETMSTIIDSEIISGLWDIASYAKPNVGMTTLNGILTNLPLPIPLNPYGAGKAIKDVVDTRKALAENGWVFFIQKARASAENCPNKALQRTSR
ncbi:hypothetical protein [Marinomonas mediterranea]|uniref:hypothetical protein n=1 Tax=Marinomonas mediterranea TaxID=119864 RepID=UPI00234B87C5|nr:hypothetical protein [Marinomonas mediterranea]WCN09571.1 hypothetical protein GV055_11865 [Marinomonas mediterranea]